MIEINYELDLNLIFTVIIGGIVTVLVPIYWQWNSQRFQFKINVINELTLVFSTQKQARTYINNKINKKYCTFNKQAPSMANRPGVQFIAREIALDYSLDEFYEEFRNMDDKVSTESLAYTILFANDTIKNVAHERENIFGKIISTYYEICHTEKSPAQVVQLMEEIILLSAKLKESESLLAGLYLDSFSLWSNLKKKFCLNR